MQSSESSAIARTAKIAAPLALDTTRVCSLAIPHPAPGCLLNLAPDKLLDNDNQAFNLAFNLPVSVRDSVSVVLVVHPVAAFLALAMFIMAAASHLYGPAHSPRYLLLLFLFILITFVACLLAFLVDVLLFIPHLAWGSYMVLAATIILGLSGIGSCAMRRAVVSRIAHRRRIEENAEMSGENYYTREGQSKLSTAMASNPTLPVVSDGKGGADDGLPLFASFENKAQGCRFSDEGVPPIPQNSLQRTPHAIPYGTASSSQVAARRPPPPRDPYALASSVSPNMYGGGRGAAEGYGGYGGAGYGRGGPTRGIGGYGRTDARAPQPRDMYANQGERGPPPTYNNAGQYDRRPSADGLNGQQPPQSSLSPGWYAENAAGQPDTELPRAESPPPLPGNGPSTVLGPEARQGQQVRPQARHDTLMTVGSQYSTDE